MTATVYDYEHFSGLIKKGFYEFRTCVYAHEIKISHKDVKIQTLHYWANVTRFTTTK